MLKQLEELLKLQKELDGLILKNKVMGWKIRRTNKSKLCLLDAIN